MAVINNILKNNKCLKLICGAGNENLKEIEKLVYIYAKAGFNMIDLSAKPEVIRIAQEALKKAEKENEVIICVSIGLTDDIHLSKAVINKQKCNYCLKCVSICKSYNISFISSLINVTELTKISLPLILISKSLPTI